MEFWPALRNIYVEMGTKTGLSRPESGTPPYVEFFHLCIMSMWFILPVRMQIHFWCTLYSQFEQITSTVIPIQRICIECCQRIDFIWFGYCYCHTNSSCMHFVLRTIVFEVNLNIVFDKQVSVYMGYKNRQIPL